MKDDIKEILDIERYRNKDGYIENISLTPDEIHKILDYITNLQEENERLKEINKEQANHLISKDNLSYEDYKSRNEKAIEILEQDKASASFNTAERIALNILQGEDKDE